MKPVSVDTYHALIEKTAASKEKSKAPAIAAGVGAGLGAAGGAAHRIGESMDLGQRGERLTRTGRGRIKFVGAMKSGKKRVRKIVSKKAADAIKKTWRVRNALRNVRSIGGGAALGALGGYGIAKALKKKKGSEKTASAIPVETYLKLIEKTAESDRAKRMAVGGAALGAVGGAGTGLAQDVMGAMDNPQRIPRKSEVAKYRKYKARRLKSIGKIGLKTLGGAAALGAAGYGLGKLLKKKKD